MIMIPCQSEQFAVAIEGSLRDILRTQGMIAFFVFLYLSQVIYPAISNLEDVIYYI